MKRLKIQKIHYGGTQSKQKNKVNKQQVLHQLLRKIGTIKRAFSLYRATKRRLFLSFDDLFHSLYLLSLILYVTIELIIFVRYKIERREISSIEFFILR